MEFMLYYHYFILFDLDTLILNGSSAMRIGLCSTLASRAI